VDTDVKVCTRGVKEELPDPPPPIPPSPPPGERVEDNIPEAVSVECRWDGEGVEVESLGVPVGLNCVAVGL